MPPNASPPFTEDDRDRVFSPHEYIWKLNMLLATLLQVKFQQANGSPFGTKSFPTVMAFIITVTIYSLACFAEKKVASRNPDFAGIIGYYGGLCGFLSNALLVRMLVPTLGLITIVIWGCCFLTVTVWSRNKIIRATVIAVEKLKTLMSRGRRFNTEPNESANKDDLTIP